MLSCHSMYNSGKNLDAFMFLASEAILKGEGMGRRCLQEKIPEEDVCYSWENSMEKVKLYTSSKKNNNINAVWLWVKRRGGICNLGSTLLTF